MTNPDPFTVAGNIRAHLRQIRDNYETALDPGRVTDDSDPRSGTNSGEPINLHNLETRADTIRCLVDPLHDELDRLRTENADLTQELATVRDTLRHRPNALNATGTHNDQLRAQLERIRALPNHWRALLDRGMEFGIEACIDDMHAILADKEPTP